MKATFDINEYLSIYKKVTKDDVKLVVILRICSANASY